MAWEESGKGRGLGQRMRNCQVEVLVLEEDSLSRRWCVLFVLEEDPLCDSVANSPLGVVFLVPA